MSGETLFFDIEGNGLYDNITKCWCIVIGDTEGKLFRYSDGFKEGHAVDGYCFDGTILDALERLSRAGRIIGHNIIGFDIPALRKLYPTFQTDSVDHTDTLVLSRLFRPDRAGGHSLRAWGERLGFPKGDYDDWTGGLTEEMLKYCDQDVRVTIATYKALKQEVKGQRWGESIKLEHEVAKIISDQEVNGVCFDKELADKTIAYINETVDSIDSKLKAYDTPRVKAVGTKVAKPYTNTGSLSKRAARYVPNGAVLGPFQPIEVVRTDFNSVSQVKKFLSNMGWQPTELTPAGGGKLTEDSFGSISVPDVGSLVSSRVGHKHRLGQIQGWCDNLRPDGRISAGANTNGTPTGRMRHSRVVNVPACSTYPKGHEKAGQIHWVEDTSIPQATLLGSEMRAMFCAPEGYSIVGHDASGLELRMLAHYMNDPEYTEILLNGDIHSHNQELAGLHTRSSAKTFIYAFIYGAGDAKLGSIVEGAENEGAELRRKFLSENPQLNKLINKAKRAARDRGYLIGLDGRRLWLRRDERGRVMEHKALNTLLQAAGAIVMKKSMVLLNDSANDERLDFKKVIDMHDEGQAEVWTPHAERYAHLAEESVRNAGKHFELRVPLDAEAKIGKNWAETH